MADKLTQQITEALTRAAADASGRPLYSSKSEPGLFPNTASAKPAAQKCLADELIRAIGTDAKAKTPRELYGLTDKGWEFLLAAVNPKQVLEDFVRVLEARQGEVGELLDTARRMADSLHGLKEAVARVLPTVEAARVEKATPPAPLGFVPRPASLAGAISAGRGAGRGESVFAEGAASEPCMPFSPPSSPRPAEIAPASEASDARRSRGVWGLGSSAGGVGLLTALAPAILACLADHRGPTDCTLPELFRALALTDAPTIGEFHDCLRELHADGAVALHSWTGPLYALPEPQFALLVGHGIAYYASLRG